jgi:quercetin dioxygenase-like cupin family protein
MIEALLTRKRLAALGVLAVIGLAGTGLIGAGLLEARDAAPPAKVEAQHLLTQPVAGDPTKEVDIQLYTFPPGSAVPWHIHPGAQEFEYELEGTLMIEVAGEPPRALKPGEAFHLAPDVVHRGWNPSKTESAKVYVVRIKPVGSPLAEIVKPPEAAAPNGPAPEAYPGLQP